MPDIIFSWRSRYTITIGTSDNREHDIAIADPTENEILSSPLYRGNREDTRRAIVRRKADDEATRFCNRLAFETESPTSWVRNSLDFMENGERKFSEREVSIGMGGQIGTPISEADFQSLEKDVSTRVDNLLDNYTDLYNRSLKTSDIFEKYKLLYLIASKEAYKDLALRTIRNMLHHTALDPSRTDKCRKADDLFGINVRMINLSNPDHQKVVRDHLPSLKEKAKAVIASIK